MRKFPPRPEHSPASSDTFTLVGSIACGSQGPQPGSVRPWAGRVRTEKLLVSKESTQPGIEVHVCNCSTFERLREEVTSRSPTWATK